MDLLNDLLATLPDGRVAHVNIGLHWTPVVVEVNGQQYCGLASTLHKDHYHGMSDIPQAGKLESLSDLELALFVQGD